MEIRINGFKVVIPKSEEENYARMRERSIRFVLFYSVGTVHVEEIHEDERMRRLQFRIMRGRMDNRVLFAFDGAEFHAISDLDELCRVLRLDNRKQRVAKQRAQDRAVRAENRGIIADKEREKMFAEQARPCGKRVKTRKPHKDAGGDHSTHSGTYIAEKTFVTSASRVTVAYYRRKIV